MKITIKSLLLTAAMFCVSGINAKVSRYLFDISFVFCRYQREASHDGPLGPAKIPPVIFCPTTAIYDNGSNTLTLSGVGNNEVEYTTYSSAGTEIESGTTTLCSGHSSINLTGSTLTDGCYVEVIINGIVYVGDIES